MQIKIPHPKCTPKLGELTLEASAEGKLACIMPCKEEEDKVKVSEGLRGMQEKKYKLITN